MLVAVTDIGGCYSQSVGAHREVAYGALMLASLCCGDPREAPPLPPKTEPVEHCGGWEPRLVADADGPVAVGVDAEHVYWAELGHRIMRIPKAGGTAEKVADDGAGWPLIVDGNTIYWTTFWGLTDAVRSAPTSGGPVVTLAESEEDSLSDLAQDGGYLYWQALRGVGHTTDGFIAEWEARVARVHKRGGSPPEVLLVRSEMLHDLTAGHGQVVWTNSSGVERLSIEDGAVETVFTGWALAVTIDDDGGIHFSATGEWGVPGSTIFRATNAGIQPVFKASQPITALLVHDQFIYFVINTKTGDYDYTGNDTLLRVTKAGSDVECLAELGTVGNFRLDGNTIYWSVFSNSGRIMALDL